MSRLERQILGACIFSPEAADTVVGTLTREHFQDAQNCATFDAIASIHTRGHPVEIEGLLDALELREVSDERVNELLTLVPTSVGVEHWVTRQLEHYRARRLRELAANLSPEDTDDAPGLIASATEELEAIARIGVRSKAEPMKAAVISAFEAIEEAYNRAEDSGIRTGFADVDAQLGGGMIEGAYTVVAARPSMGKSAYVLQMALNAARAGVPVYFVSAEMPVREMVLRALSLECRFSVSDLRQGRITDDGWADIAQGIGELQDLPIYWDDSPGATVEDVCAKVAAEVQERGVRLVIVDYLQILETAQELEDLPRISLISRRLKGLARKLDVHVVAVAQLSRGVESRQDKRPMMSDLRGSGTIEQDADVIAFLYRDEYYNRASEDKGTAELIIAKQRQGPTGTVKLAFQEQWARFRDLSRERE